MWHLGHRHRPDSGHVALHKILGGQALSEGLRVSCASSFDSLLGGGQKREPDGEALSPGGDIQLNGIRNNTSMFTSLRAGKREKEVAVLGL